MEPRLKLENLEAVRTGAMTKTPGADSELIASGLVARNNRTSWLDLTPAGRAELRRLSGLLKEEAT